MNEDTDRNVIIPDKELEEIGDDEVDSDVIVICSDEEVVGRRDRR